MTKKTNPNTIRITPGVGAKHGNGPFLEICCGSCACYKPMPYGKYGGYCKKAKVEVGPTWGSYANCRKNTFKG